MKSISRMHHRLIKESVFILILLNLSFLMFIFISNSLPDSRAYAQAEFPSDFTKMQTSTYRYEQTMDHWLDGRFTGKGNFSIKYDFSVKDRVDMILNYDLQTWHKSCEDASNFTGEIYTVNDLHSRYTLSNPITIGTMDLDNMYTNLFLGDSFSSNLPTVYFIDDLMYIHGVRHQEVFSLDGYELVSLFGAYINTTKISWSGQLLYAGFLCGIGAAPLINATVTYYYEVKSGILIYSESTFMEYLPDDPSVYQYHHITKYLTDLTYEGQPIPEETSNNVVDEFFSGPDEARNKAVVAISMIIIGAIISIKLIQKYALRYHAKKIAKLEEKLKDFESDSKNTRDELTNSENDKKLL